jgi:UPF0716 family protein affecting phage T7 exclusion
VLRWLIPEIHGVWLILPGMVAQTLAMGMFVPMLAPFAQHHLGLHPQQYALVLMADARCLRCHQLSLGACLQRGGARDARLSESGVAAAP